jgi:copper chaperone CopZ
MRNQPIGRRAEFVAVLSLFLVPAAAIADDKGDTPKAIKYQITGLFERSREQDLLEAFAKIPEIKLVRIDFDNAEATLEYVPAKVFPNAKPEQVLERLDSLLKSASSHTFGVKPQSNVPREKLRRIEIPVAGLDCKACSLAAYEAIYKLEGVERATASFREGRVTAWIDPAKTDRSKLEAALKQRGVQIQAP